MKLDNATAAGAPEWRGLAQWGQVHLCLGPSGAGSLGEFSRADRVGCTRLRSRALFSSIRANAPRSCFAARTIQLLENARSRPIHRGIAKSRGFPLCCKVLRSNKTTE